MIPGNALGERLNALKNGIPIPEPPSKKINILNPIVDKQPIFEKTNLINNVIELVCAILISILYGYGIETIFAKNWTFIGTLGVGFILNQLIIVLLKLFKHDNKK